MLHTITTATSTCNDVPWIPAKLQSIQPLDPLVGDVRGAASHPCAVVAPLALDPHRKLPVRLPVPDPHHAMPVLLAECCQLLVPLLPQSLLGVPHEADRIQRCSPFVGERRVLPFGDGAPLLPLPLDPLRELREGLVVVRHSAMAMLMLEYEQFVESVLPLNFLVSADHVAGNGPGAWRWSRWCCSRSRSRARWYGCSSNCY
mmetsp:Transcript_28856/g.81388  ORF Transcript_28856/g.81388 Transcript_28856/m.81388 type:complete len:202 (+) Transcript_28856:17-622(+)